MKCSGTTALRILVLLGLALTVHASSIAFQAEDGFDRGVEAYRRGDYGEAGTLWRETLEEELSDSARARIFYNLGNAAWREGKAMEAIGWYSACLKVSPRHADAWYNLELVRAETGLEPADRGDLRSTARRAMLSLRVEETRLLALAALLGLLVILLLEAVLGGELLRWLSIGGGGLALLLCMPFFYRLGVDSIDPMLVVRAPSVSMRAEPATSRSPIGEIEAGEEVERIDMLPGWIRVVRGDGVRGWVQEDALFALRP